MVDLDILRTEYGLTQDKLKELLFDDLNIELPGNIANAQVQVLRNRIRARIQEGVNRNLSEGRHYYALDQAWDKPFQQITPTLLQSLMDKDAESEEVNRIVTGWGLAHMLTEDKDAKTGRPTGKKRLNVPMFFNVFVPLVRAYVTIRWAKIVNDRRLSPFLKYEPAKSTAVTRLKCEAITDRVQVMSEQYSYFDTMKQAVLKMLHYSYCMQFIKEEWHDEEQVRLATAEDVQNGVTDAAGIPVKDGGFVKKITREGLRFHHPHPARTIRDIAHPAYTYNSDSGCEYGGYWRIMRYKELFDAGYWNTERVSFGGADMIGENGVFFNTVYPCTISWPTGVAVQPPSPTGATLAVEGGVGVGDLDREKKLTHQFYTRANEDHAVLVTEYFEKLIPKDNGLGTYDCPVWFRFVIAGDQATVLYATPLPSTPIVYYGYDEDASRSMNASLTLEVLPFQDQFSNMFTQLLLTVKQNLANLVLVDEDQVETNTLDRLKNYGERFFRSLNIQGFKSRANRMAQNKVMEAVQTFKFPQGDTGSIITSLKVILDTLERVLVMSSQEVGQAASHEQTREEIMNIKQSSSSRQTFTCIPVDLAREAWKRQIYSYLMSYGQGDYYAHIPSDAPLTKDLLDKLGFTYQDTAYYQAGKDKWRHVKTNLKQTAVDLFEFASTRDGEDRTNEKELATTLSAMLQGLMKNPITAQAIGPDQAIGFANQIAYWAGIPKDFSFHNAAPGATQEQQKMAAQQQLQQVIQAVMQNVAKGLEPLMDESRRNSQELAAIMRVLHLAPPHPAHDSLPQTAPTGTPA